MEIRTKRETALSAKLAATQREIKVLYVSTYPPRECGIATYTRSLTKAINQLNPESLADIIATDNEKTSGRHIDYPWEVKYKIHQEDLRSWINAADYVNQSGAEVVNLQHEFGICGGVEGEYSVAFMDAVTKPIVVCFHTILPNPTPKMLDIVKRIAKRAEALIVMVDAGGKILEEVYGVDPKKIVSIPHGVPDIPFGQNKSMKRRMGYGGWKLVTSFGLFSPSKGYEHVIKAMPEIIKKHPKTKLLLLGETHPVLLREVGEEYRNSLKALIKKLKVTEHVEFVNKYLTLDEIVQYLRISDVYITPYPNMDQISSGTLSYAVSAGLPCISSPYTYAKEVLSGGRGSILKELNELEIIEKVNDLLDNPKKRAIMSKKAYAYGRNMIWSRVALRHLDLFEIVANEYEKRPAKKV